MSLDRRSFLTAGAGALAAAATGAAQTRVATAADFPSYGIGSTTFPEGFGTPFHAAAKSYMQQRGAPGMQFALVTRDGKMLSYSFGYEVLENKTPLQPERLFQIGSISKSFAAICALQLHDEGKLDLHRPVLEYLPWLPWSTPHGAVTTHHILTHTTGLAGGGPLFFADDRKHVQRYAPGERYFYSNMAFNVIGHLVAHFDGRNYQQSLRERIFNPAGMANAVPYLGGDEWMRQSQSYVPAAPDAPYKIGDALRPMGTFHEDTSAGCIAATPGDMGRYMAMLLGNTWTSSKTLLTKESFALMRTRHIAAPEFGPTAGYGYGIAVDRDANGDELLRHTGGMVSFMSAISLNLTQGIAAFASINAQQGYRPTALTEYACHLLAATRGKTPLPEAPAPPKVVAQQKFSPGKESHAYSGTYVNDDPWSGTHRVTAQAGKLLLDSHPLADSGQGFFWIEDEVGSPNRADFARIVDGRAQILFVNGIPFRRTYA